MPASNAACRTFTDRASSRSRSVDSRMQPRARRGPVGKEDKPIVIGIFGALAYGSVRLTRPQHELHRDERRQNQADEWHGITRKWCE